MGQYYNSTKIRICWRCHSQNRAYVCWWVSASATYLAVIWRVSKHAIRWQWWEKLLLVQDRCTAGKNTGVADLNKPRVTIIYNHCTSAPFWLLTASLKRAIRCSHSTNSRLCILRTCHALPAWLAWRGFVGHLHVHTTWTSKGCDATDMQEVDAFAWYSRGTWEYRCWGKLPIISSDDIPKWGSTLCLHRVPSAEVEVPWVSRRDLAPPQTEWVTNQRGYSTKHVSGFILVTRMIICD